jgi:hypothetical protein
MQLLYSAHFQISSRSDETTASTFDRISGKVKDWMSDWYTRHRQNLTLPKGDILLQPLPGHSLSIRTQGPLADGTTQTRFIWMHSDSRETEIYWHVSGFLSLVQGIIEFTTSVSRVAGSFRSPPKFVSLGRPRIVRDLLVSEQCSINNFPLGVEPISLADIEIPDFMESVLASPSRVLPFLLVSPEFDGSFPVDAGGLADKLAGICTVGVLNSQAATYKLTDLVGKELSCFNGASRLYWPGFSAKSSQWQHPLFLAGVIKRFEQAKFGFHGEVIGNISAALALRSVQGDVTRRASLSFAKARRDEIDDIKHRHEKGLADQKDFEGVLKLIEEERDTYKDELEKTRGRADRLLGELESKTQELEEVKRNWRVFEEHSRGDSEYESELSEDHELVISTVEDAVVIAKDQFQANLDILDSALESAADCPFQNPSRVFEVLKAVDEVADTWKKSLLTKTSMGGGLVDVFRTKGVDFKKEISQTSRAKFEQDYTFSYQGRRQIFEQHITEGSGSPNTCFSVHMLFDKDAMRVIVAHVGKHLPNTST